MNEIKCPHCGEVFTVDESNYQDIVSQVKNKEFVNELKERERLLEEKYKRELELANEKNKHSQEETINELNNTIALLRQQIESENKLKEADIRTALEVKEKEISNYKNEIASLKGDMKLKEEQAKNLVKDAISDKEKEILELQNQMSIEKNNHTNEKDKLIEKYKSELDSKQQLVDYYKDLKTKMSTKLVGETLEQHCLNQFNSLRMTGFKNAYFDKDNDAKSGSKGDFIFRDYTDDGLEYISIMFEMKNENDTTATKHKNADFFKELDKDRQEKGCEYAVLVSMLEADSELYNAGIVDVSYAYPKMYVVRPQNFIAIISLLRNAALNSVDYQRQLLVAKSQNVDVVNFEDNLAKFQESFGKQYGLANDRFNDAINEIDKTIKSLQKTKDYLLNSSNHLRIANDKAQDLSIKKLTKNNPTMKQMFEDLKKEKEDK